MAHSETHSRAPERRKNTMNEVSFILERPPFELLPEPLVSAARGFVLYLDTLPFSRPPNCPRCGSESIYMTYPAHTIGNVRDSYLCRDCGKQFNILTGTPLRLMRHHAKWSDWMRYRFSGLSQERIASLVEISNKASLNWDKAFIRVMETYDKPLHVWWHSHQSLTSTELSPHVKTELDECQKALHILCYTKERACPVCDAPPKYVKKGKDRRITDYVCSGCGTSYNNLTGTPFTFLHRIDAWPKFLELMVHGYHDTTLQEHFDFDKSRTELWRRAFMKFLKQDWPVLAHWAVWMWSRRRVKPTSL